MSYEAKLYSARLATRKLALVASMVRGKPVSEALNLLKLSPRRRMAMTIEKVIRSAVANAVSQGNANPDHLQIDKLLVNKGATIKRFKSRAKGSASPVLKRTSHLVVSVRERA